MRPEQAIQNAILEFLRWKNIPAMKINNAGIFVRSRNTYIPSHTVGMSDIYACLPPDGKSCWIEVKTEKGKPSEAQLAFIETIKSAGGIAFVARSIDDVEKQLQTYFVRNHTGKRAA